MRFSRQEYWSGLPFPSPGDLPNPGIKPVSLTSPILAGGVFTTAPPGKPLMWILASIKRFTISFKRFISSRFKMETLEDPECTSSHKHIKSTATYGKTSSEKKKKNWLSHSSNPGEGEKVHTEAGERGSVTISPHGHRSHLPHPAGVDP